MKSAAFCLMLLGTVTAAREAAACGSFDHDHGAWSAVLRRYVRDGVVDYAGIKRDGARDLAAYERAVESVCRSDYDAWTSAERLAFWINAYNAYTVKLILDHYPVGSIRSIGLLPGSAFRTKIIPLSALRGDTLSLNDVENDILRKEFAEPRIHFAIVCASKSCPALRREAYRAADLDRQLTEAARDLLRDPTKNRFDAATRTFYLSSIFKWFREDFERAAGSVTAFVARYAGEPAASELRAGGVKIQYLDYDWSLNGH